MVYTKIFERCIVMKMNWADLSCGGPNGNETKLTRLMSTNNPYDGIKYIVIECQWSYMR